MRSFKVTVNGNEYDVTVEETPAGYVVPAPEPKPLPAVAPRPVPQVKPQVVQAPAVAGGVQLKAPMPGTVLSFKVKDGDIVKKGDVIVVLEAMKMENDISAPADGAVRLAVRQGAAVTTGELLAVIG
jgi:biotin carboxyl carrier protein